MQLTQCIKGGSKNGKSGWLIGFHYDEETVELVKTIPHTEREWREESKIWWVSENYTERLKQIFPNFEALAFLQGKLL